MPADEVARETDAVIDRLKQRVRLPGFRPGKAPAGLIRRQFADDIRQQVLENLLPRFIEQQAKEEDLEPVGSPSVTDLKFEDGEPLVFTVEFEVAPEIELGQYTDLTVTYADPEVTEEDVETRIEEIRQRRAEFVNVDPRPLEDGDFAVLELKSLDGVDGQPIKQDDIHLEIGGEDTVAGFSEALRGASPGDECEFDVTYPEDYGQEKLAGKTVHFHAVVKGVRRKELPEINDEFAQDLGDFQNVGELREEVRRAIHGERQFAGQQAAKDALVEQLVDLHEFPVPNAYVDRQIRSRLEQGLRQLASEGVDIGKYKPNWDELRERQKDRALREVKASLLLSRIAEREAIGPTRDEVDREVERIARQQREPVAAVRMRFEKDGTLGRIAGHLQTQKVLDYLFEHARKVAGEAESAEAPAES